MITNGAKVKGEDWLTLSRKLEKQTNDRLYTLKNHGVWKKKNASSVARDQTFNTLRNRHKLKKFLKRNIQKRLFY